MTTPFPPTIAAEALLMRLKANGIDYLFANGGTDFAPIIEAYVEEDRSPEDIAASGVDRALVDRVVAMIDRAEYKRRQAPPGVKITPKAFGRDRRLPITNRYGNR